MNVSDIMTRDVQACSIHDNLERAAQIMWDSDCGCVPVLDDDAHVVGMLTDRDICMAGYTQGKTYAQIPVTTAMARQVFGVSQDDLLETAELLMRGKAIRRLPVFDGMDRLVGILSLNDIARHSPTRHGARADGLSHDAVAQTLAAISEPHRARRRELVGKTAHPA